jgi:hypothetical protein
MTLTAPRHDPIAAHRGPFRFELSRPNPHKPGFQTTQWLHGSVRGSSADVRAEALALLTDPRDTITSVGVYSETEQQYVMVYRKGDELRDWSPIVDDAIAAMEADVRNASDEPADLDDGTQNPEQSVAPETAEPIIEPTRAVTPAPATIAPAPAAKVHRGRSGAVASANCPYSGTRQAEKVAMSCPSCGHVATPVNMGGTKGKPGALKFPYHKPKV